MKKMVKEVKKFTEVEHRKGGQAVSNEFEEGPVKSVVLDADLSATVEAKLGMTISLGNYEFLRVDAGVSYPCSKHNIKEGYEEAFALAGEELFKRVAEAKQSLV